MKLIKDLGTEQQKNSKWVHFAYFFCDFCQKQSKKRYDVGIKAKGCGCFESKQTRNNYKHGETDTKLYYVWCTIKNRCLNSKSEDYKNYGGRGITICPEWTNDYIKFRDWALSNGYKEGLQIHREDDENYEPNSCKWVTSAENNRHKRNNKFTLEIIKEIRILWFIGNYTQKELAEKYNTTNKYISKIITNKIWII